jgi:tryptophan synthase alpha chain
LPIAVGFGISTRSQATEVCSYADAAVVGSAIVSEIARLSPLPDQISEDFVEKIGAFAHSLLPGKIETV